MASGLAADGLRNNLGVMEGSVLVQFGSPWRMDRRYYLGSMGSNLKT